MGIPRAPLTHHPPQQKLSLQHHPGGGALSQGMALGAEQEVMPPPPNVLHCMSEMLPPTRIPQPPAGVNQNVITSSIDEGRNYDQIVGLR